MSWVFSTQLIPADASNRAYEQNFDTHLSHFEQNYQLLLQDPSSRQNNAFIDFRNQIDFIAHLANCFPHRCQHFPDQLITLLSQHHESLDSETREKLVGSLVLLRRKGVIDSDR